jgi:hypothetical protein
MSIIVKCPHCKRSYAVKEQELTDDMKCWFCHRGIHLQTPPLYDGKKKEEPPA